MRKNLPLFKLPEKGRELEEQKAEGKKKEATQFFITVGWVGGHFSSVEGLRSVQSASNSAPSPTGYGRFVEAIL